MNEFIFIFDEYALQKNLIFFNLGENRRNCIASCFSIILCKIYTHFYFILVHVKQHLKRGKTKSVPACKNKTRTAWAVFKYCGTKTVPLRMKKKL